MYKVIKRFFDLQQDCCYAVGDEFPRGNIKVDADRINELSSNSNKLGVPLIVEIADKPKRARKKKVE